MVQDFGSCTMLAGGKSTRMGRDKELITDNTARILAQLNNIFTQIIVSTKNPALYKDYSVTTVNDILTDRGPLGGIFTALCLCRSEYLYVQPCDMPNIGEGFIQFLLNETQKARPQICIAASLRGIEPLLGFYSKSLLPEMREFLLSGKGKVRDFLEGKDVLVVQYEQIDKAADKITFTNVNFPHAQCDNMQILTEHCPAVRFDAGGRYDIEETVAKECVADLYFNDILCDTLIFSPQNERELCIGRLFSLGLVKSADDIDKYELKDGEFRFYSFAYEKEKILSKQGISCDKCMETGARERIANDRQKQEGESGDKIFEAKKIISLSAQFLSRSEVFDKTGCVHSAAVSDGESLLCFFEDIGRFNVVDKCVGYCLLNGICFHDSALLTSGRVAGQIVEKAMAAGFALLISRAAPTARAILLAKENNFSLIAFARNGRFNIYSGYEKVVQR